MRRLIAYLSPDILSILLRFASLLTDELKFLLSISVDMIRLLSQLLSRSDMKYSDDIQMHDFIIDGILMMGCKYIQSYMQIEDISEIKLLHSR